MEGGDFLKSNLPPSPKKTGFKKSKKTQNIFPLANSFGEGKMLGAGSIEVNRKKKKIRVNKKK